MKVKNICLNALFIAIVCVMTLVIKVPVPATNGYIHIGDSAIILIACFFGPGYGWIAGGVGSALADLLSGYPHWAPFTFIIKALMGLIMGKISDLNSEKGRLTGVRNLVAVLLGGIWQVTGYFFGGALLKGSFLVSLSSVPENIVQAVGSIIIFYIVGIAFYNAKIYRYVNKKQAD